MLKRFSAGLFINHICADLERLAQEIKGIKECPCKAFRSVLFLVRLAEILAADQKDCGEMQNSIMPWKFVFDFSALIEDQPESQVAVAVESMEGLVLFRDFFSRLSYGLRGETGSK